MWNEIHLMLQFWVILIMITQDALDLYNPKHLCLFGLRKGLKLLGRE